MSSTVLLEYPSTRPFQPTLTLLLEHIEAAGLKVFATIDHAAGAREVGLSMPPTVLLVYGHPRGGTPALLAVPRLALDLPLRALLREEADGRVLLSFHPVGPLLEQSGIAPALMEPLEHAQKVLVSGLP